MGLRLMVLFLIIDFMQNIRLQLLHHPFALWEYTSLHCSTLPAVLRLLCVL